LRYYDYNKISGGVIMNLKNLILFSVLAMLASAYMVFADVGETITVTFVIPTSVSHTVYYGDSCSSSLFYFIDEDGTYDGNMDKINVSSDATENQNWCQNTTTSGMKLDNTGNNEVNFTAKWASDLEGIDLVAGINWSSYGGLCDGIPGYAAGSCTNITDTYTTIANNSGAGTNTSIWWWAIMNDFNSGASTSGVTRDLNTNATAS